MREIPLTVGRRMLDSGVVAIVDDSDFEAVSARHWRLFLSPWGRMYGASGAATLLHRFILNAPRGYEVTHLNGDGLDCRRENLALDSHSQHLARQAPRARRAGGPTSSRFKGVSRLNRTVRPWRATISVGGRQRFLGTYDHEFEAARAYDHAAFECFGMAATLNFGLHTGSSEGEREATLRSHDGVAKAKADNAAARLRSSGSFTPLLV